MKEIEDLTKIEIEIRVKTEQECVLEEGGDRDHAYGEHLRGHMLIFCIK